jgi:tetratricopeptide (TPR) repeat protein
MPEGNKCPHCNIDIIVFNKIVNLSDSLYNKGLAQAKDSDLTGAASYLEKSIRINKDNVQAYNLLGLVRLEMGHIGEAVKNWVISTSRSPENNPATGYIEELNKNSTALEKINDAVTMYNNALTYVRQKSDDLAIIQLKKAIEINPKFIDALNLLTLCYLIQQEKDRASQLIDKVLTVDIQNPIALNYYSELHPGRRPLHRAHKGPGTVTPVVTRATPPPEQAYKQPPIPTPKKRINFHFGIIIAFILGVACAFAVFHYLMMPAFEQEAVLQREALQLNAIAEEQRFQQELKDKSDEINSLNVTITELNGDIAEVNARLELQLNTNRVLQAYNMYTDGHYQEAVDIAGNLNVTDQPPDIVERYQSIFTGAYPQLAELYFASGDAAFQKEDYATALPDLQKCEIYMAEDNSKMGWLIYRLGRCYYENEATRDLAVEYLTEYTTNPDYSNQGYINNAKRLLRNLQG